MRGGIRVYRGGHFLSKLGVHPSLNGVKAGVDPSLNVVEAGVTDHNSLCVLDQLISQA